MEKEENVEKGNFIKYKTYRQRQFVAASRAERLP